MTASLSGVFSPQQFTDAGAPAAGYRLYTYSPATTTHKVVYTDAAETTPHTYTSDGLGGQYIALNSRGELPAALYLSLGGYDLCLKTSAGATVWTRRAVGIYDGAGSIIDDLASTNDATKAAGQVGFSALLGYATGTVGGKLLNYIDVRDFGAKGDGTTDDTDEIIAAMTALPNGGTVFFPRGTYLISQCLLVPYSNIHLRGERGAVIKLADSTVGTLTHGSMISFFQKRDITVEGLEINGNKANNDINDNYGNGINCYDSQRVRILNCYIHDCPRDGITVSDYSRISAGALGNLEVHVIGNLVTDCGAASQTTGGEGILVVEGDGVIVTNNICRRNKYRGIEIEVPTTGGTYKGLTNIVCSGNICTDNSVTGIGINGASKLTVGPNICEGNADYGMRINSSVQITNAEVSISIGRIYGSTVGLSIENYEGITVESGTIASCGTGIYMADALSITIGDAVQVSNSTGHGIDFSTGTNSDISISAFVRNSNQGGGAYHHITGNATYARVQGARLRGTSAQYAIVTAGSGWTISDNVMDNGFSAALAINDGATASRVRNNGGYITEASGSATINSGATSVVVSHGCSKTPSIGQISVIGAEDPTNTPGAIWVSSITSTQFTINVENNPGASNFDVGWRVHIL